MILYLLLVVTVAAQTLALRWVLQALRAVRLSLRAHSAHLQAVDQSLSVVSQVVTQSNALLLTGGRPAPVVDLQAGRHGRRGRDGHSGWFTDPAPDSSLNRP